MKKLVLIAVAAVALVSVSDVFASKKSNQTVNKEVVADTVDTVSTPVPAEVAVAQ